MLFKRLNITFLIITSFSLHVFAVCSADFSYDQTEPQLISFTNLSESFEEGTIHYYWDFGDGQTSYETNPIHVFSTPGIYDVSLSIVTSELCYDRTTKKVFVGIPQTSPYCQLDIHFQTTNATAPYYDDGTALVYGFSDVPCCYYAFWSNGDEGEQIYDLEPGTYCVTLTNGEECYGTNCVTIGYNDNCSASFLIDSTSFSHLEGAYRFVNNSHGEEDFFRWDFGDGTFINGSSPLHIYDEPGTYNVCLEINTLYGCIDTYCSELVVPEAYPLVANLYGIVNAGETLLPEGIAVLYRIINDEFTAIDYSLIQNGQYTFYELSRDYLYLTHLIPHFSTDETYFPKYFATYTNDEVYWQNNPYINLYSDTLYHSNLKSYNDIYYGTGSISGVVEYSDINAYEESVFGESWILPITQNPGYASNMVILLKDQSRVILDSKLSDENGFYLFEDLDFGDYYLSVEKGGMISDEIFVSLIEDDPNSSNNNFNITQTRISKVSSFKESSNIKVYPNPFSDYITINNLDNDVDKLEILDCNGKIIKLFYPNNKEKTISTSSLLPGIYTLKLVSKEKTVIQKIIKI